MKRLAVITDFRFWERNSGSKNRTWRLLEYLDRFFTMTVYFVDRVDAGALKQVETLRLRGRFIALDPVEAKSDRTVAVEEEPELKGLVHPGVLQQLTEWLSEERPHIVLNTNIRTHGYMQRLPSNPLRVIDLHDLMYRRAASFRAQGVAAEHAFDERREFEILNRYDLVLAIQQEEHAICVRKLGASKVLLVPHAVMVQRHYRSREYITDVGFVATDNPANFASIRWFVEQVWPWHGCFPELTLNVYGTIVRRFKTESLPFVRLIGPIPKLEQIYRDNDVMISPMRMGSGLKIKNVEALAYGMPLLTTPVGAEGMTDAANCAYLLAETVQQWREKLTALTLSKPLRDTLSQEALMYAEDIFGEEACYGPLVGRLKELG